jgi:hypothetical protein
MRALAARRAADVAPYRFNAAPRLAGDPIVGASVTATAGLTVREVEFDETSVTFWLMDGAAGETGLITCAVTTASGVRATSQVEILTR